MFGLESGDRHGYSAESVADSEIALVRRSMLEKTAAADGAVARKLWSVTSCDLRRLQDHMLLLGRKSALERVVSFLAGMFSRNPVGDAVDLAMSRSDIADYLGLTVETISRALAHLERNHTISMPTSRHIILHGRLALAEA